MLDVALELAAESGADKVVLGMAHRGRLNVIAHTVGRPYDVILREFEGERLLEAVTADPEGGTGDVKYHYGARGTRQTQAGELKVRLASNPSHLEYVDPVVEGMARAAQTDRTTHDREHDPSRATAVLIHGDAAFPAEGIVAETLNLQGLDGYSTGGTLHIIANNQLGFTTRRPRAVRPATRATWPRVRRPDRPRERRRSRGRLSAVRLAFAFRNTFGHDVVIDLVGYRRFGHNEGDEPAYTQPLMYEAIERQRPVREQYAAASRRGRGALCGRGRAARHGRAGQDAGGAREASRLARERRRSAQGASSRPRRRGAARDHRARRRHSSA